MDTYTGFHHLAFVTGDMERTVRFWRDLLGMRLVYASGRPGYRQYFFSVSDRDFVSFFEWPEARRVAYRRHGSPATGPMTFDHVSIGVADREALYRVSDLLAAADMPVSDVVDHGFVLSVYTYDPNGIPLEFTCNAPGIDIHRQPMFDDPDGPPSVHEGPDPIPDRWPEPEPLPDDERVTILGEGWEHFSSPPDDR
ncbi:MAG: VOC family protein [Magnetococcales bacterium]|nr:VOC family protein [Magnetococcales bacterium]